MNTLLRIVGAGLLGGLSLCWPSSVLAKLEVTASLQINARTDFDAPLAMHGLWVTVRSHGRCWRPAGVALSWRPYCDGYWVWTDCGWYWYSDEPWAWACYHYGTWIQDTEFGWVWIPDIEWAPAWVYWRVGGGFIGWAPRPPSGVRVAPSFFSFVAISRFPERVRPSSLVVNDTKIINRTKEITAVKRATRDIGGGRQKVVINDGPGIELVQKARGKVIEAIPIQDVNREPAVRDAITPPTRSDVAGPPDQANSPAAASRHRDNNDPRNGFTKNAKGHGKHNP
jgi:hypothetical protein